ncbi:MAG: hypothetical protein BGO49_07020 [Planctomycetales bacterium 71-10]|nr:MAG: hypothetical protein BGO49_07020 [Planctomycetales bacterium 71-10]
MATGPGVNQGKGKFLEEFLPENRDADEAAINQAWRAEGHDDDISGSLVSKTRSRLKIPKKRAATGGADAGLKAKDKAKPKEAKGKAASRAEEAPPQPDGREDDKGPSKSAFVEELLGRQPEANVAAVKRAWAAAGHEGAISPSVFYKIKRERGLNGGRSPGESEAVGWSQPEVSEAGPALGVREEAPQAPVALPAVSATASGGESAASGGVGRVVDEVEAGIDDLMFTLKVNGGMPEVEAALRAARRLLVRSDGT